MDIDDLPPDLLRALYSGASAPRAVGAARAALRAADAGVHVEVAGRDAAGGRTPIALDDTPARPGERVITLRFGGG